MTSPKRTKLLVIGQTPPPLGGQTLMIEWMIEGLRDRFALRHIRPEYSTDLLDSGRFHPRKLVSLFKSIVATWWALAVFRPAVVYYPPGGTNRNAVVRDVAMLLAIRPFVRRLVLHYHAAGTSLTWANGIKNPILRLAFHRAFFGVDAAFVLSNHNPPDGTTLEARQVVVIPNGMPDERPDDEDGPQLDPPVVLFAGAVMEDKGVFDLAAACGQLWESGVDFELAVMGECLPAVRQRMDELAGDGRRNINYLGVLRGPAKWEQFRRASLLCNPTFFGAESFSLVTLEAMMCERAVVASRWRGIQDLVDDGETGLLVEPHDVEGFAAAVASLIAAPDQARAMGRLGREKFESSYRLDRFVTNIGDALEAVAGS